MNKLSIVHTSIATGPESYGHGPVVMNLLKEQYLLGHDVMVWSMDNDAEQKWAAATYDIPESRFHIFPKSRPFFMKYSRAMEKYSKRNIEKPLSIVHQHGIWAALSRTSLLLKKSQSTPSVVIAPHGSLHRWALNNNKWKKNLAKVFYENDNLHNASCLHATSENEVSDFRNYGLRNPIAIIPNGISEKWLLSSGNGDAFRKLYGISSDRRILLFLSRITPKKGLMLILQSIYSLKEKFSDWVFVIVGSDEFGHKAEIQSLIEKLDLNNNIVFTGPLFDHTKRDVYAAADVFVLPSHSEGAPIVILESLAAGIPVIATKASPWNDLAKYQCGWLTEIDKTALTEALEDAISKEPAELIQMGKRGKMLVASEYTWTKSAQMTIELYEWLLGKKCIPNFVITN